MVSSSVESGQNSLYMNTFFFWPILWMREMTWFFGEDSESILTKLSSAYLCRWVPPWVNEYQVVTRGYIQSCRF